MTKKLVYKDEIFWECENTPLAKLIVQSSVRFTYGTNFKLPKLYNFEPTTEIKVLSHENFYQNIKSIWIENYLKKYYQIPFMTVGLNLDLTVRRKPVLLNGLSI